MSRVIFFLICILSILGTTSFGQNSEETFAEKRLIYKDCEIPYELVVLSINHLSGDIYVLAEDKYFNETDLTKLFVCLSKKYPEFARLDITLFSDRNNLNVAIRQHFGPTPPHTNPPRWDTSDYNCENPNKAIRPCPYGYARATYFRFDGREFFDFTPDPKEVPSKRVYLQK